MPARRPKVLIVDDEDNIVLALHRVLYQDNDRYDVLLARSAEIAQQILEDGRVDVLVTDVHLPEKSGMDLLSWVAVQAPSTRVIVMTAFDVSGIKDRAHAFGCLQLIRKPFDVHAMRAAIVKALALRDSFTGSLSELSCVDVLQMLCIARKSTALRLSEGASAGVVHIQGGEPVHAVWDDLVGEEAFFRILGVKSGLFYTTPLPPDVEKSLHGDWQYLMIEGLRRLDEANAARGEAADGARPESERSALRMHPASVPPPRPPAPAPRDSGGDWTPRPTDAPVSQARAASASSAVTLGRVGAATLRGPEPAAEMADAVSAKPEVTRLVDEGFSALRAGRREDARRAWEEALKLDPQNRMLELNLKKLGPAPQGTGTRQAG